MAQISEADLIAMFRGERNVQSKVHCWNCSCIWRCDRVFEGSWNPGGMLRGWAVREFVWIAVRKRFLCQMELCWAVLLMQELVGELYEMTGRNF